jgi:hypothetical protein
MFRVGHHENPEAGSSGDPGRFPTAPPGPSEEVSGLLIEKIENVKKRLFICCDGTWQDGVNNNGPITNVSRLARCVKNVAGDGYLQIVYYDSGVGNGTAWPSQTVDGATGRGKTALPKNL